MGSNDATLDAYRRRAQIYVERTTPDISGAARVFLEDACRGLSPDARWYLPWRYGRWTGRHIDPATRLDQ